MFILGRLFVIWWICVGIFLSVGRYYKLSWIGVIVSCLFEVVIVVGLVIFGLVLFVVVMFKGVSWNLFEIFW